jgi:predicted glutamine amidotransferase
MNCNVPTDICFSFEGFATRGGKTDDHRDGWGIAFFEGKGCRMLVDSKPSIASPVAELVRSYPIRSTHVDLTVDFRELTTPSDRVAIIATTPLTDNEIWTPFQSGELLAFQDGLPVYF